MKLPRNFVLVPLTLLVVLAAAVVWGLVFRGEYESEQSARREFTIATDFTDVRKILVRTEATKQIVTMGGGSEYVSQEWSGFGGDLAPGGLLKQMLEPTWKIQLHGVLRVRTLDDYVGEHVVDLGQDVVIEPDYLDSRVALEKPTARLRDYRMTTHFQRDKDTGGTRVELTLAERIRTDAPWFAHGIADRRVRASVERTLANQEAAIRKLVADNLDNVPLLPLR